MKKRDRIRKTMQIIASALGCGVSDLTRRSQDKITLYRRYLSVQVLKEEGYKVHEIALEYGYGSKIINRYCALKFEDLITYNREFKNLYLKVTKAVEDQDDDD